MAREKTCNIYKKIKKLLGSTVPAVDRLGNLDDSIWKLGLLKKAEKNIRVEVIYKKKKILGYCRSIQSNVEVEIDDKILERIIKIYEDEYNKQLEICESLISKLEG